MKIGGGKTLEKVFEFEKLKARGHDLRFRKKYATKPMSYLLELAKNNVNEVETLVRQGATSRELVKPVVKLASNLEKFTSHKDFIKASEVLPFWGMGEVKKMLHQVSNIIMMART